MTNKRCIVQHALVGLGRVDAVVQMDDLGRLGYWFLGCLPSGEAVFGRNIIETCEKEAVRRYLGKPEKKRKRRKRKGKP